MSITEMAVALGASPEEVSPKLVFKCFKGRFARRDYQYICLDEPHNHLCVYCADKATCKEVLIYKGFQDEETEDSTYYAYLCTKHRDREVELAERRKKPKTNSIPDERYIRYAGYSSKKPSFTKLEYEVLKAVEQSRRDASGKPESVITSSSEPTSKGEHINQATS